MKNSRTYIIAAIVLLLTCLLLIYRQYSTISEDLRSEGSSAKEEASSKNVRVDRTSGDAPSNIRRASNRAILPTVDLIPTEVEDAGKSAVSSRPTIRQSTFTAADGSIIKLELRDKSEILGVEANPEETHFLVSQGSPRFSSIYNREGELVADLPRVADALPESNPRTQFNWKWVDANSLIATLGFIHEVTPNQYPESPTDVYEMRLYLYDLGDKVLRELRIPNNIEVKGVLRLDGVFRSRLLKISSVPLGEDYNDANSSRQLGYFQIPE
jgi:hypothetical protein